MKTKFIIPTQESDKEKTVINKSLMKLKLIYKNEIKIKFILKNKESLSKLYQNELNKVENDIKCLVFLHDDMEIYDTFILEKLERAFKNDNDVVGLAGSSINLNSPHLAWGSSPREHWRGIVGHPFQQKPSQTTYCCYGWAGDEAVVGAIDGLFIALNLKKCRNKELFDDTFGFHFYDFDFSMNCFMQKLRVCVMDIMVKHFSIGEGIFDDSYKEAQKKFKQKWSKILNDKKL